MQGISVDFKGLEPFIQESEIELMRQKVFQAHDMLEMKTGEGRNMIRLVRYTRQ